MSFTTDLITKRDMTQNFSRILVEPLVYENDQYVITVYPEFDYDGASIPWLFRRVLPREGMNYDRAACLHDALYASRIFGREKSDALFLEAMKSDNTNYAIAMAMYKGVRIGGSAAYREGSVAPYRDLIGVVFK